MDFSGFSCNIILDTQKVIFSENFINWPVFQHFSALGELKFTARSFGIRKYGQKRNIQEKMFRAKARASLRTLTKKDQAPAWNKMGKAYINWRAHGLWKVEETPDGAGSRNQTEITPEYILQTISDALIPLIPGIRRTRPGPLARKQIWMESCSRLNSQQHLTESNNRSYVS